MCHEEVTISMKTFSLKRSCQYSCCKKIFSISYNFFLSIGADIFKQTLQSKLPTVLIIAKLS